MGVEGVSVLFFLLVILTLRCKLRRDEEYIAGSAISVSSYS